MKEIRFYKEFGEYGYLATYSNYGFFKDGVFWKTSEHYYQAQKFMDSDTKIRIQNAKTPKTTIMREYPCAYDRNNDKANIPYYPIVNDDNMNLYNKYLEKASKIPNFYLIGRLAQYKYFNMDLVINEALKLFEKLKEENDG